MHSVTVHNKLKKLWQMVGDYHKLNQWVARCDVFTITDQHGLWHWYVPVGLVNVLFSIPPERRIKNNSH